MVKINLPQLNSPELPSVNAFVTDTFYRPQQKPTNPAIQDLANSLSNMVPTLRRYDIKKEEIFALDEEDRAIKDFELNKNAFKELVKNGVIPEGASPYYINALAKQQLKLDGREFKERLFLEADKNNIWRDDDPAAFEKFYRTFAENYKVEKKLDSYAPSTFVEGFLPDANAAYNELAQRIREKRIAEIENQNIDLLNKNIVGILEDYQSLDKKTVDDYLIKKGVVPSDDDEFNNQKYLSLQVQEHIDFLTNNGMDYRKANETAVDAITTLAIEYLDEDMLQILDDITTDGKSKLSNTKYAKEKMVDTAFSIERLRQQKIDNDYKNKERQKVQDTIGSLNDYFDFLNDNPENGAYNVIKYFNDINKQRKEAGLSELDYSVLGELAAFQDGFLKAKDPKFIEDKTAINEIEKLIITNPFDSDLYSTIVGQVGVTINADTAKLLIDKAATAQNFNNHPFKNDTRYIDIFKFFNATKSIDGLTDLEEHEIQLRQEGNSILEGYANEILQDLQNPDYLKQFNLITDSQKRKHLYELLNSERDRLKEIVIGEVEFQVLKDANEEQIKQMRDKDYQPIENDPYN